jgi:Pyruvate/2-oxoacid:ferredoxin oxidoreductase delta subunit
MKTAIFYYTGTGNSLWTARLLAEQLGNSEIQSLHLVDARLAALNADAVGFVFPVHMWGVPMPVIRFLKKLALKPDAYCFALAVNAGQVSRTLIQFEELLADQGKKLAGGFNIILPSNYIPWGGPGPLERQQVLFAATREKIKEVGSYISGRHSGLIEKGPLWQRIIFSGIYRMTFKQIKTMDKNFWIDEKCNSCGICVKVCPAANIVLEAGKPVWRHHCEQCLACIQWCPQESIQYGKKTPAYERYHHPEITLKDILS